MEFGLHAHSSMLGCGSKNKFKTQSCNRVETGTDFGQVWGHKILQNFKKNSLKMGKGQRSFSRSFGGGRRSPGRNNYTPGGVGGGGGNLFRKKTNPTRLVHPLKGVGGYIYIYIYIYRCV